MVLSVPRIYDNMSSLGYRKRQTQRVVGYIYVDKKSSQGLDEPDIASVDFVNKTHKINGSRVTYHDALADGVMWRYIGNNKTGVFKNTQVKFTLDMDPSYNIGDDEPDNTLIVTLAGHGATEKTITGYVTGQIGCGCYAYGHKSPTRTIGCNVSDISPLCGRFTMKRICVSSCRLYTLIR